MFEAFDSSLLRAGLVDLDLSFPILIGVFIVFAVLLNYLVVKPMAKAHQARFDRMDGAREDAEKMDLRAAESMAEYQDKIGDARRDAVEVRERIKAESEDERRDELDKVRGEVDERGAEAARKREAQVAEARIAFEEEAGNLADTIVSRLLPGGGN